MTPHHPTEAERSWLLDQLGALLAQSGWRRFAQGDVLEPAPRFFPDSFFGGPTGVQTVAYRMLWWAGHRHLHVVLLDARKAPRNATSWSIEYGGIEGDELTLVLENEGPAEDLPGALAALLAAAVRERRGLSAPTTNPYRHGRGGSTELEAQLATLQTLELGWGILATEATQRIRSSGEVVGDWQNYRVRTTEHGSLGLAEMTFLLAVQSVIRENDVTYRWAKHLRPNQSDLFRRWVRALGNDAANLRARLGIPEPTAWAHGSGADQPDKQPNQRPNGPTPFTAEEMARWKPIELVGARPTAAPVFLVPYSPLTDVQLVGSYAGLVTLTAVTLGMALHLPGVSNAIGRLGSRFSATHTCSRCTSLLMADAQHCPDCGGTVAGEIRHRSDWLAAEEALPKSWWTERGLEPPSTEWAEEEPPP